MKKAIEYLSEAASIQQDRGNVYEAKEQERSMAKIVASFNTITGNQLTEREGWLFMVMLKAVRAMAKADHHDDSWLDFVSYAALAAECSSRRLSEKVGGTWVGGTPSKAAAAAGVSTAGAKIKEQAAHIPSFTSEQLDAIQTTILLAEQLLAASVNQEYVHCGTDILNALEQFGQTGVSWDVRCVAYIETSYLRCLVARALDVLNGVQEKRKDEQADVKRDVVAAFARVKRSLYKAAGQDVVVGCSCRDLNTLENFVESDKMWFRPYEKTPSARYIRELLQAVVVKLYASSDQPQSSDKQPGSDKQQSSSEVQVTLKPA